MCVVVVVVVFLCVVLSPGRPTGARNLYVSSEATNTLHVPDSTQREARHFEMDSECPAIIEEDGKEVEAVSVKPTGSIISHRKPDRRLSLLQHTSLFPPNAVHPTPITSASSPASAPTNISATAPAGGLHPPELERQASLLRQQRLRGAMTRTGSGNSLGSAKDLEKKGSIAALAAAHQNAASSTNAQPSTHNNLSPHGENAAQNGGPFKLFDHIENGAEVPAKAEGGIAGKEVSSTSQSYDFDDDDEEEFEPQVKITPSCKMQHTLSSPPPFSFLPFSRTPYIHSGM